MNATNTMTTQADSDEPSDFLSIPAVRLGPRAFAGKGKIDMEQIGILSTRLGKLVERIKGQAFLPRGTKLPPNFGLVQLAALCRLSPDSMMRRLAKAEELKLPAGTVTYTQAQLESATVGDNGEAEYKGVGRRMWTLAEARQWVQSCGIPAVRKAGQKGAVITIANFKGGVGKTVTTASLAQGLSLMGYKVLAIDFDPQGSLTSLLGKLPTEISDDMTILPIMLPPGAGDDDTGARSTIKESIQPTYWDGLDLIAGSTNLFSGEFYLPFRQMGHKEKDFSFYEVLNRSLNDGTRDQYDYILIDTMPALSYLTMNTMWAADAILMPMPPEGLDMVSSSQFWNMFIELTSAIEGVNKSFEWIGILPSKVDRTKGHTEALLKWMESGYQDYMMPVEIPATQVVSMGGTELRTVFDITKYVGAAKTYARAREAYDKLVAEVDYLTRATLWRDTNQETKQ